LILFTAIAALSVWVYSRYSGTWREAQISIDDTVKWFWDNFLSHFVASSVGPATNFTLNRINDVVSLYTIINALNLKF
jgi:hypothetical protein